MTVSFFAPNITAGSRLSAVGLPKLLPISDLAGSVVEQLDVRFDLRLAPQLRETAITRLTATRSRVLFTSISSLLPRIGLDPAVPGNFGPTRLQTLNLLLGKAHLAIEKHDQPHGLFYRLQLLDPKRAERSPSFAAVLRDLFSIRVTAAVAGPARVISVHTAHMATASGEGGTTREPEGAPGTGAAVDKTALPQGRKERVLAALRERMAPTDAAAIREKLDALDPDGTVLDRLQALIDGARRGDDVSLKLVRELLKPK